MVKAIKHPSQRENHTQICVTSYNSRGFSESKQSFCENLSTNICGDKLSVLCVQEHFLLRGNSYIVQQALPDCHIFFKSAVKTDQSSGRPKNGMFIAVPDKIKERFSDVSPSHWRVQAVLLDSLLIVNVYLPTDPGTVQFNDDELNETLEVIRNVIEANESMQVLIAGDLNTEFSRNSGHVQTVSTFIDDLGIKMAWRRFYADFTHVSMRNDVTYIHTLDHFLWSEGTDNDIVDAGVIHLVENESDHCPIFCNILIPSIETPQKKSQSYQRLKPSWKKASEDDKEIFRATLADKLELVKSPESMHCRNPKCNLEEHRNESDNYIEEVLNAMSTSARDSLPMSSSGSGVGKNSKKKTVGWNEHVKPFRDQARFWHAVWVSAAKPLNCELHNIMRRTRNIFHYQLKKCRKAESQIKKQQLLSAMLEPDSDTDIFKEIKKMRKSKSVVANKIDDKTENIEEHFSNIYSSLYNSVDDYDELLKVAEKIETKIGDESLKEVDKVTPDLVKEAVKHIKPNKSDPVCDFSSDCLRNAPDSLFLHLSVIIKSFLVHSHVSLVLLLATLVPIIKDKLGDICSSKNYR